MTDKSNKSKALAVVLAIVLVGAAGFVGWLWGNDWMFSTNPKGITPELDGVINKREWARASYKVPFYLDVDNDVDTTVGKANVDGWNYMHVAEDENFYYIGLDLCSDRTNNKDGEWIAFQLANRLPYAGASKLAFLAVEDYGYEYFFYNVSDESVFEHQYDSGPPGTSNYYNIPLFPEVDSMELMRGNMDGDFDDFWTPDDYENFTMTSSHYPTAIPWLEGDFSIVHFAVNITEKLPDEEISTFLSSMTDMDITLKLKSNLSASLVGNAGDPNVFFCAVTEHGAMPGNISDAGYISDFNEVSLGADAVTTTTLDLNHLNINATDGMFYFSLYGWNDPDGLDPTAFEIEFDWISLKFTTERMDSIVGTSIEPGNYEIAYAYGASENCAEDHRMFEFKMAKSEFPVFADEKLYVAVGGYGTMAMIDINYWVYPIWGYPLPPIFSSIDDTQDFIPLDMSIT